MAAYNPNGAEPPGAPTRDEGYLYWLGWLGHVGNSTFQAQDAHGALSPHLLHRELPDRPDARSIATPLSGPDHAMSGLCWAAVPMERGR